MILPVIGCVNRMSENPVSYALKAPVIGLDSRESMEIWSVQSNREHDVSEFCHSILGIELGVGEMSGNDLLRILRHWPNKVFAITECSQFPQIESKYTDMITDVSDAYRKLTLTGETALQFLDQSSPLDFMQNSGLKKTVKTLCGQYPIIVWWDDISEIKLLIERSLSESYQDYLSVLANRFCFD